MRFALELFGAAFIASVFGSMVGLGGGFILVPILRIFLGFSPAAVAGTSLVLIVANSASGAFTYFLHKRIHLKIGLLIALGGLPSTILGAILSVRIPAKLFDVLLAVILIGIADRPGAKRGASPCGPPRAAPDSRDQGNVVSRRDRPRLYRRNLLESLRTWAAAS